MRILASAAPIQIWFVIFLLSVCLAFFSFIPQTGFVYPHLVNSGHAFVFGLGAYLLMLIFSTPSAYKQVLFWAIFAFLLGVLVELLQPYFGRQRSIVDAYYDLLGSVAAACWFISSSSHFSQSRRFYFRLFAVLLILSSLVYPGYRLYIQKQVDQNEPVIANFESFWWANIMWANNKARLERVKAPKDWSNESWVGRITFTKGARYPGISFAYIRPDWRSYDYLEFDLYSTHTTDFSLALRVHDLEHQNQHHDRYNKLLAIKPGFNFYSISIADIKESPRTRELDLMQVKDLMLFISRPVDDMILYVDNIRLRRAN
jgi:VanZ family protein